MNNEQILSKVDEILSLYKRFGDSDYIGEPVSQIEHMCQCAQLAESNGASPDLVLAAFFHDIGHLCEAAEGRKSMEGYGTVDHERLGADFIRSKGFSQTIADLINSHVAAKRYLTFTFPDYYDRLSEASKITLKHQGGRMNAQEADAFRSDSLFEKYISLRTWDERAKVEHKPLPSLDHYRELMITHLQKQSSLSV